MAVGSYRLFSNIAKTAAHRYVEWIEESCSFEERLSLVLDGTIGQPRRSGSLRVKKRSVDGLPLSVTLRVGKPFPLEKPEAEQTQPRPGGRSAITALQLLGFAYHHEAWADDETRESFPQQIFAEINVEQPLYQDAWHWVRNGHSGTGKMWVEVFGKGMRLAERYFDDYDWLFNDNDYEQLYVCGFGFTIRNEVI